MKKISVSKAKCFNNCKLQFNYTYINKFSRVIPKEVKVTDKGLVMHQIFEDLVKYENYKNDLAGPVYRKAPPELILALFRDINDKHRITKEDAKTYNLALGVKRWMSFKEYLDNRGHTLYAEKSYNTEIYLGTSTTAILDLIEDLGDDKYIIYDYKTPKSTDVSNYKTQLAIYSYLMAIEKGLIEKGSTNYDEVCDHFKCFIFFPLCEGSHEDYKKSLKELKLAPELIQNSIEFLKDTDYQIEHFDFTKPVTAMFPNTLSRICDWCSYQFAKPQPEIGFEGCPLSCFAGGDAGTTFQKD